MTYRAWSLLCWQPLTNRILTENIPLCEVFTEGAVSVWHNCYCCICMSGDCLSVAAITMRFWKFDSYFKMTMGCAVPSRVTIGPQERNRATNSQHPCFELVIVHSHGYHCCCVLCEVRTKVQYTKMNIASIQNCTDNLSQLVHIQPSSGLDHKSV